MKPSTDPTNMQMHSGNAKVLKMGNNTMRLNKQLSQGQSNFGTTKPLGSTKSFIKLSENSLSAKSKTIITA